MLNIPTAKSCHSAHHISKQSLEMNTEENCDATVSVSCWNAVFFYRYCTTAFVGLLLNVNRVFFLCHLCRILHLAIIHEEEFIAQQLIQLFPKEVLDIQNNLYQVSDSFHYTLRLGREFLRTQSDFLISWLWKLQHYLYLQYFQRDVVPLYLQSVLSQGRHCGWFQC